MAEEFESDDDTAQGAPAPAARALTYVDADGITMEWDESRKAYFPKVHSHAATVTRGV